MSKINQYKKELLELQNKSLENGGQMNGTYV